MNSPTQEQQLFAEAQHHQTPEARNAFLDNVCGSDPALRRQIESLLRASDDAGDFLELPPIGLGPGDDVTLSADEFVEQPGDRIGRYKLLQKIGEGGCGVVYMAEQQEPVRRRVALKVIKLGMDTRQVIARFEAERQALAMMDHPNIARVLEAGATGTGRPYFVMELVRGVRITDYCDHHHLPTRERLTLLIHVCQAIHHAHQKGIIHRDIKPSNILVADHDGVAVPKVIDFGIAKATTNQPLTDKTLFTALEQFVGTPAYMSPEQANLSGLDIDTRSDIYSLGVLLYEVLTGLPPFDAQSLLQHGIEAMRRAIREKEPARPSTRLSSLLAATLTTTARQRQTDPLKLVHLMKGDLDWIVMKCLEKDRSRRYESASGLGADIQRHLDYEPVLARPASFGYRAGKWIGRHKGPALAAGGVAVSLCAGLATSTVLYLRERQAWLGENTQRVKAETEAAKSAQTSAFMMEMLAGVTPEQAKGRDVSVLTGMLETAARRVEADLTGQPEVESTLRATIGHVYGKLGLYAEAQPHLERAHELYTRTLGSEHRDTLAAAGRIAKLLSAQGRFSEAERLSTQLMETSTRVLGVDDRLTLELQTGQADICLRQKKFSEAGSRYQLALEICTRVLGPEDGLTMSATTGLALTHAADGRLAEAEALHRDTLARRKRVMGPEHPETLAEIGCLAGTLHQQEKLADAEALYLEALEIQLRIHGPEHPDTLIPSHNLGTIYLEQGRLTEAETIFRKNWKTCADTLGSDHDRTLTAKHNLAITQERQGKLAEAEALIREVLRASQRVRGKTHPDTLDLMHNLASVVDRHPGGNAEAEALYREALAIRNQEFGPDHLDSLVTAEAMLLSLRRQGKTDEAEALCRQTLDQNRHVLNPDHPTVLSWMNHLAQVTAAAGHWEETMELWKALWTLMPNDSLTPLALAATQAWFGKTDDHAAVCRQFFEQVENSPDPSAADRAAKAFCLLPSSDPAGLGLALRLAQRALESAHAEPQRPYYQLSLGMAEYRNGRFPAADEALRVAAPLAGDIPNLRGTVEIFQAMSHFRQGRTALARQQVSDVESRMAAQPEDAQRPFKGGAGHDDLIFWMACREARALFASGPATDLPPPPR